MTADDLETDVCCFFVIVTGHIECERFFKRARECTSEEAAGRVIFVNQIYLFRRRFFL